MSTQAEISEAVKAILGSCRSTTELRPQNPYFIGISGVWSENLPGGYPKMPSGPAFRVDFSRSLRKMPMPQG
jgi:hypothetical protein